MNADADPDKIEYILSKNAGPFHLFVIDADKVVKING